MRASLIAAAAAAVLACAGAATPDGLRDSQTIMLPMRDGVKLHTVIDFPLNKPKENLTAIVDRSPYGMYAIEMIADIYTIWGFVAVRQDLRGTKQSEGNFTIWHASANDGYDTLEWIAKQPWSNGNVFTVGASADGLASFEMITNPSPNLKAQFIIFASAIGYPIAYPGGAYRLALDDMWMNSTVPDQSDELIHTLKENEARTHWWDALSAFGKWGNVKWPTVMFGGWYDIFLDGNLVAFDGYQKNSDPSVRGKHKIVIDPLGHCQAAHKSFPNNLIYGRIPLPIFLSTDLFKGIHTHPNIKAVTFYVMGPTDFLARGNYWTTLDDFPTYTPTDYYLNTGGALTTSAPTATDPQTYLYDPSNPVSTVGGNNLKLHCGPLDQSAVENRTDVVSFETGPLSDDVWVTGPLKATLYVESTAVDTDFTVKITDVYPTGESKLIQDGIRRMRWRDDTMKPEPMKQGVTYKIEVNLWNTSYVWNKGHSIRVSVSSSNYPRFTANRNNGLPLLTEGPSVIAHNTLHISPTKPSHFTLPVVTQAQLPKESIFWATKNGEEQREDETKWMIQMLQGATGGLNYNEGSYEEFMSTLE